jgi:hypothetical protein
MSRQAGSSFELSSPGKHTLAKPGLLEVSRSPWLSVGPILITLAICNSRIEASSMGLQNTNPR